MKFNVFKAVERGYTKTNKRKKYTHLKITSYNITPGLSTFLFLIFTIKNEFKTLFFFKGSDLFVCSNVSPRTLAASSEEETKKRGYKCTRVLE